ncbi:MAG TPA: hypothetical protein VLJ62_20685 [Burkholderiaceae bacterium]|nr:hypothetical protein [Burkholderiaceae bacterium]
MTTPSGPEAPGGNGDARHEPVRLDDAVHTGARAADDLIGRIARSAHEAIDHLANTAAPHVNRLQERVSGVGDSLHAGAEQAREVTDEWAETVRCTVRENPLAAVGLALAVGVLIARLTR